MLTSSLLTTGTPTSSSFGDGAVGVYLFGSATIAPILGTMVGNRMEIALAGGAGLAAGVYASGPRAVPVVAHNTIYLGPTSGQQSGAVVYTYSAYSLSAGLRMVNNLVLAEDGTNNAAGVRLFNGKGFLALHGNDFALFGVGDCMAYSQFASLQCIKHRPR